MDTNSAVKFDESLALHHSAYREVSTYRAPIRPDAFDLDDESKIDQITSHFAEIMHLLGLDMEDDSLSGTPNRVAKMYVKEIFSGLNPANKPEITLFENKYNYKQMLVEKDIPLKSTCEHHFLPILGKAHVAYFPKSKVVGLSKLNRIVDHFSRRPQVQERLTMDIAQEMQQCLHTEDVAVIIEAGHMCIECRGIKHQGSSTTTSEFRGKFINNSVKQELLGNL